MTLARFLADYVRRDSSNPPGDCRGAVGLLASRLEAEGLSPLLCGARPEKPNLLCHVGGTDDPALLLVHHADVVPAKADEWSVPPFSGEERDGYLYGRGTLDTKGLGAAHLFAALRARRDGLLKRRLYLAANADEEVGGDEGAAWFAANLPAPLGRGFALNEGGEGAFDLFGKGKFFLVNTWEKGPLWLKLHASGKAGHGSRPSPADAPGRIARAVALLLDSPEAPRLVEPVRSMLEGLHREGRIGFDPASVGDDAKGRRRLETLAADHPFLEPLLRNTCAATTLSGGYKPNVIPSEAEATLDCRLLPGEEPAAAAKRVADRVAPLGVAVEVLFSEAPSGSPRTVLFDVLEKVLRSLHPGAVVLPYLSTGFTDSRFYRALDIPTYGLAPALLPAEEYGRIHGVDERISLEALNGMEEAVYATIREWNVGAAGS
jgi:acetylornithine deacetylase/succinyl-diaminopimelate desuccinylase-like protein